MPLCKWWPDDGYPCIYDPRVCAIADGELICAWEIERDGAEAAESERYDREHGMIWNPGTDRYEYHPELDLRENK